MKWNIRLVGISVAVALGAADEVLPLSQIADRLLASGPKP